MDDIERDERDRLRKMVYAMASERHVMDRVRDELAARGWKQIDLVRRMEDAAQDKNKVGRGGVISRGALSKLLGDGRGRHVSIDQLVTLAAVFDVPLEELLVPRAAADEVKGWRKFQEATEIRNEIRHLLNRYGDLITVIDDLARENADLRSAIQAYHDDAEERVRAVLKQVAMNDGEPTDDESIQQEIDADETPAIATARDVLMRRPISLNQFDLRSGL